MKCRGSWKCWNTSISHNLPFSLLIPDFEMVNSGTGREWKFPFPKFGNGKGMKKSIPKIREREGNEKRHSRNSGTGREWTNPFPKFGNGNQRPPFLGMTGNGNSRSPLLTSSPKESSIARVSSVKSSLDIFLIFLTRVTSVKSVQQSNSLTH